MNQLNEPLELIENITSLASVVLSGRRRNYSVDHERIDIRPVALKNGLAYQMTYTDGKKMTTKNFEAGELDFAALLNSGYANITIRHKDGEFQARFTKKDELLVTRLGGSFEADTSHDRVKSRLLKSTNSYLVHVGISDSDGVIKPSMMSKYKQIEEFLRLVTPDIKGLGGVPKIVDCGAGSGYLTFALHQYLHQEGIDAEVIGVDSNPEFEEKNSEIARKLGIEKSARFITSKIVNLPQEEVDVVIALHACDIATDDALSWAIKSGARAIFVAPCCHHDIQKQMKKAPEPWSAITSHGIMKERLGDLITDALRMELLEWSGYGCDAIEFIGDEHTPRNLMIRGKFTGKKKDLTRYQQLTSQWGVESVLHRALTNR